MRKAFSHSSIDECLCTLCFCVSRVKAVSSLCDNGIIRNPPDTVFYYHASWAMSKMKLKSAIAEHLAVGLMTVLIDMPYDINGAKYVHWVWHDTDPNIGNQIVTFTLNSKKLHSAQSPETIAERHYWVPWNSYYFHSCFSASFQFFYHTTRKLMDRRDLHKWERGTM